MTDLWETTWNSDCCIGVFWNSVPTTPRKLILLSIFSLLLCEWWCPAFASFLYCFVFSGDQHLQSPGISSENNEDESLDRFQFLIRDMFNNCPFMRHSNKNNNLRIIIRCINNKKIMYRNAKVSCSDLHLAEINLHGTIMIQQSAVSAIAWLSSAIKFFVWTVLIN